MQTLRFETLVLFSFEAKKQFGRYEAMVRRDVLTTFWRFYFIVFTPPLKNTSCLTLSLISCTVGHITRQMKADIYKIWRIVLVRFIKLPLNVVLKWMMCFSFDVFSASILTEVSHSH